MPNNFITNQRDAKTLRSRLRQLITHSSELKFLVGFFYFSGWRELYESIKSQPELTIKILVGLRVEQHLGYLAELGLDNPEESNQEKINAFFESMRKGLNHKDLDTREFYEQVDLFVKLLENKQLIIRKTREPNHAKLYIFKMNEAIREVSSSRFITGSSNLTSPGLHRQNEFNVEISDYGTDEAEAWFDDLWEKAIPITEDDQNRIDLITFIRNESQAAIVEPFEAYAFILKTWIDLQQQKTIKPQVVRLLEKQGYRKYNYQLDAVNQALTIIDNYNGVIIADVVGLGKSIIASAIGKNLGKRGLVLCPPGLIGNDKGETGWRKYLHDFELYEWEVRSVGKLEEVHEYLQGAGSDIEVIVVDEAHRFRNEDTEAYEWLSYICKNRTTILLTATPFSNTPADIFSLLKLFIIPGESGVTLDPNLQSRFRYYKRLFDDLSYIQKNYNSDNENSRIRAENRYLNLFPENQLPIDLVQVRNMTRLLGEEIKSVVEPVMIRRNRIDLKSDVQYKKEVQSLSNVRDPQEHFYELTPKQSEFYDAVISTHFGHGGDFTGAIYQPFRYENEIDEEEMDELTNRAFQQQQNLYDFMRRLIVKRFESSFGAFNRSIRSFARVHEMVLQFIINSGGKFILNRSLMEKIYTEDPEIIEEELINYTHQLEAEETTGNEKVYEVDDFFYSDGFYDNIRNDLSLFQKLINKVDELDLVKNDPKLDALITSIPKILEAKSGSDPLRKIVIFTEYVDTVNHLKKGLKASFGDRMYVFDGNLNKKAAQTINENFDASVPMQKQKNEYDILVTTDKLSEGFNLNRAGAIINYDIPWNPTRVIQRLGRINRIGNKVFEELHLYNYFPTEQGSNIVKSRQIATQKMYLIHNTLGEDAKIFHTDEEPSASELFKRLHTNPENQEEESLTTILRNKYAEIVKNHPDVIARISKFPYRIKTAKESDKNELIVVRKKGMGMFFQYVEDTTVQKPEANQVFIDKAFPLVECKPGTPRLDLSKNFWDAYETAKKNRPTFPSPKSQSQSLRNRAFNNLMSASRLYRQPLEEVITFIDTLIRDLRKYNTLPDYSLRRIIKYELNNKSNVPHFIKEIIHLRRHLGDDYLQEIEERAKQQEDEVIVGVENCSINQERK